MASASVLPPIGGAGLQHYATRFPDFNAAPIASSTTSPLGHAFPRYASRGIVPGGSELYDYQPSFGAIAAAKAVDSYASSTATTNRAGKRKSWNRTKTPPPPASSVDTTKSQASRATLAKDRFKSNLKKVAQQKEDQSTTLDLSKTAEENERRTGISIYSQGRAAKSATDVHFTPLSRRRNHTFHTFGYGTGADYGSFKPSVTFVPLDPSSRPGTPQTTRPSYAASTVNSVYSADSRPSMSASKRPSLHINTSTDATSIPSVTTRARRNTNQSSASANTPSSRPRKSLEKAMSIMTRRDSNATDEMMDPAARVASIQAARQAFDERQEKKDAKYEKRAARDRERQDKFSVGKSSGEHRARGSSNAPKNSSTLHISEKVDDLQGSAYDELPAALPSSWPTIGLRQTPERITFSRKRHVKNRYAGFLSWLKTKFLNLKTTRNHS